jgi:Bardet-Biedl syndrome 2 protein
LVYQVDDNLEIFFKEITEGVRCLQIGSVESTAYLFVGTLTTVTALNEKGDEIFWIVSSADHPINTIILYDFSRDNEKEIILGSEDKIRIYKKDKFVNELSENAPIKQILPMGTLLAFILDNGTIGIYEQYMRLWRIKSKVPAMAIASYDLLGTNSVQLITGWENGKVWGL